MIDLRKDKRVSFKELVEAGAYFFGNRAYVLLMLNFRKVVREFERKGKRYHFCAEGLATKGNYSHLLPHRELTE